MSWATYKTAIVNVLESTYSLTEIPENKKADEVSMATNKNSYQLQWIGASGIVRYTNNTRQYNHRVKLQVRFLNINSADRHTNAQTFLNLLQSLHQLSGFAGFMTEPTFEDIDNKHTKAEVEFIIGTEVMA